MIPNVPNDLSHRELRDKNMKGRTVYPYSAGHADDSSPLKFIACEVQLV
jgi:hypothetical protein